MSNTEINSLLEIAKNLESKGLYAQADKAREIMVRLSQGGMYFSQPIKAPKLPQIKIPETNNPLIDTFIREINELDPYLQILGLAGLAAFFGSNKSLIALGGLAGAVYELNEIKKLLPKFDLKKMMSGEDLTGYEIIDRFLGLILNILVASSQAWPVFAPWVGIVFGVKNTLNVKKAKAAGLAWEQYGTGIPALNKALGIEPTMPGGEKQMKEIEEFVPPEYSTDPAINKVIDPIFRELQKLDASKFPKPMGLDFFAPYIKKYDTENKFKDLFSLHPSVDTMKLKRALTTIVSNLRYDIRKKGK
jgi:hypothetical protein